MNQLLEVKTGKPEEDLHTVYQERQTKIKKGNDPKRKLKIWVFRVRGESKAYPNTTEKVNMA